MTTRSGPGTGRDEEEEPIARHRGNTGDGLRAKGPGPSLDYEP